MQSSNQWSLISLAIQISAAGPWLKYKGELHSKSTAKTMLMEEQAI